MSSQCPVRKRIAISLVFLLAFCVVEAMAATPRLKIQRAASSAATAPRVATNPVLFFFALPPCRVFDSRQPADAPALAAGVARTIQVGGTCGVPATAKAVAVNVTVTNATAAGNLELYPGDGTPPGTPVLHFPAMRARANHAIVQLSSNGDGTVKALYSTPAPGKTADLILDVTGYYSTAVPVAVDDSYTTTLNTALNTAAPGVLANDTQNTAVIASYGATTGAEQTTLGAATPTSAGGSITLNADGSFAYTPLTGFKGDDTFKYVLQGAGGSSTATVTLSVGKGNQTISFTSTAPVGAKVGGPTYTVTATATSGLTVAFTIDASASAVCTISGSTVSFIGVGTCVVDANQAGDTNYNPAPQVQQSFAVGKGDQTISFTSTAPVGAKVGGPTYTVTATATSGLPVAFTIDPTASAVCSISGSTVSFLAVGTCVIDANQAGDANWNAAPQVQQSFAVGKGDQTITFTSTAPAAASVGGPTYTVTATASSGLPVTFTIDASASAVCSISGSTVSFQSAGTCVIDANQAGNANYNAAPQAQQSFGVGKSAQTITFTSTAPVGAKVGGPTYTVTATASSSLTVAFTIDASASTVCSLSGSTVSFIGAGTCVIDANQAGDANYNPAPQVQQSFAVAKGDQTITFTSTAPAGATVGGATYTVTATASSGLPVAFTIDPSASAVCSLSGSTVSFQSVGTCVIDANQAGDANWNAAPQAQQSFPVAKGNQTITFTSTAPVGATVGGATYTVTATASSGLPVTFTIDPTASAVCSLSGSTVSFIGAGTCVIDANQAGNANYNAAPQAQQSFPVGKGNQTITFTSTAPVGATVGGPTYTVTATASSGLPVTFTIDPSASTVCSLSGSTVSFIGAGTCVIDANQAGNANYNAAPQAQQSFPVVKGNQTITFTSTAPASATVGGPTYTVTATASSGLPVTFTIDASATSVCSLSGSTVSFIGAGTCVIDANQAGNASYNAAPQVQQSFAVVKGNQTITFTSTAPAGAAVGGPTYTVTATASSGLTVALTIDATATSVCSISGSTVSFLSAGTCVIDANQAGNASYNAAPQVQQSFAVAKGSQTITFTSTAPVGATVGGATYTVTATASSGLPVTLTIDPSATAVCSLSGSTSGSTVSFIGAGTCVIDANQPGDANYNAAPQAQQSFPVAKGNQTITYTSTAPVGATVGGATYTVTATASSGLPVTFTIDASATSVCSISGSTVSFIGAGTCVIDANQPGNANYNAAPQVQQSFAVVKGNQTISFTSAAPAGAKVGGPTYTVTATATSGLPVTFTIDASATSVCSISGSTVSFIGAGICVIDANQPGNASYNAAPQVQQSFQVNQSPQITSANATSFTSTSPGTFTVTTTGVPSGAAMNISASGALPSGVTFVNNNNGTATLAGTPAAGTQGTYPLVITADNGVAPAATQNFTLTILNHPPQLATNPVTYTTPGNTQLHVAGATLPGVTAWTDPSGLLAKSGATDADGPGALSVVPASGTTGNGGSYSISANGSFTYVPAAGFTGADSFTYQVTDTQTPTTGTVNITVGQRVWYVRDVVDANNAAGGDGRSTNAFDSIAAFNAATTNNGDIIFVFRGNTGTTPLAGNLTLKDGQKLWGEGIGLTLAGFGPLVPAGSKPVLNNSGGDAVSVPATAGNRQNVEVRGMSLQASGNAVKVNSTGANLVGVTISDNDITAAGLTGVNLSEGASGAFSATLNNNAIAATGNAFDARTTAASGALTIDFSNNAVVSNATGIFIDGSAGGTTTIIGFANNAVSGNTVGTGISITSAKFDAVPGGTFQTVFGGLTVIGASGNGVGGAGMVLSNVSGDLSFTDLDIFADAGAGLSVGGTGTFTGSAGFQIVVGAGVATVAAIGGPAVNVSSATINLPFQQITSTNSATTGVSLDTVGGTFSTSGGGSSITNATGTGFNVNAGNAAVTYDGTITGSAGRLVSVTSTTGGTKSFTNTISGTGQGIFLNANTGATINFSNQLTLSTGGNDAFTATGGGTVTTTNTLSTVATTTGTAVNIANTTIGASGVKFKSVSAGTGASGPVNGIVLNNTGASGGFTVLGGGGAGTGGTIQRATGDGISLTSTRSVSLTGMLIQNITHNGISGTQVVDFSFLNGTISNTGTAAALGSNDSGIAFHASSSFTENNVSGNVTITGSSISNAFYHAIDLTNWAGTISNLTISGNTLTSSSSTASSLGDGIHVLSQGSATTTANITTATVTNNVVTNFPSGNGITVGGGNSGSATAFTLGVPGGSAITITGNQISGASAVARMGNSAINAPVNGCNGQSNYVISNNGTVANPITNVAGVVISHFVGGNVNSTATVNNNVLVSNNTAGSSGIAVQVDQACAATDAATATMTVNGNSVSNNDGSGIRGIVRNSNGSLKLKVQSNTVTAPLTANRNGIRVDSGSATGNTTLCLNMSGNTSAGSGVNAGLGVRKQGTVAGTNTFGINGLSPSPATAAQTQAKVTADNPAGGGTDVISGDNFVTCVLP